MNTVEDSTHFSRHTALIGELNRQGSSIQGVIAVSERDMCPIKPLTADHYVDQFKVTKDDGRFALIDIHHFGRAGLGAIFPTIIRMNEDFRGEHQIDIFSIDANGFVLAHTNMKRPDRKETRDNSLERLIPYEAEILERSRRLPLTARLRIEDAFNQHKLSTQS